jgi:iron complex transport system substrate-binding protein
VRRIVSLIASATEIVCALGFEDQLVGRSHECDYPESVKRLPVCTEPKFSVQGTSFEIDQRVRAVLQESLSVYRVKADLLKELRPDVIVTQTQCEVCAVSLRDVERALAEWTGSLPRLVSLAPDALADVWQDMLRVAEALGVPDRGRELVRQLRSRMADVAASARSLAERPTVACVEWIEPLMASGNWMPELVEMAGGVNLFGTAGSHAPRLTWEQLRDADPDVIVVLPCGFEIERSRRDMPALTSKPEWPRLRAVREGRVYVLDGNAYFNRPGPRLVESLEILAEVLHSGAFRFGHEGTGWQRLGEGLSMKKREKGIADRLQIIQGDITRQEVVAIVNAANTSLLGGGGVDGAIHRAAGPQLLEECRTLGGCPTGDARITRGYKLAARHVIHTAGPVWRGGGHGEDDLLAQCYRSCFAIAREHGVRSIAFPSISTGAYRFPIERAARIALTEINDALRQNPSVDRVLVVCYDPGTLQIYEKALDELIGATDERG